MSRIDASFASRWVEAVWGAGVTDTKAEEVVRKHTQATSRFYGMSLNPGASSDYITGPEDYLDYRRRSKTAFPDLTVTVIDAGVLNSGGDVFARYEMRGTHTGTASGFGQPTGGRHFAIEGWCLTRLDPRGEHIAEERNMYDRLGMLTQLGMVTLPAALVVAGDKAGVAAAGDGEQAAAPLSSGQPQQRS